MSTNRPHIRSMRWLAFTVALAVGGSLALGQDPATQPDAAEQPARDLPEAKAVIADYVSALGGEKALRAVKSRKLVGTMSMGGMGADLSMTIFSAAPNKMLLTATSDDFGSFRQGFDGKVAWAIIPQMGAQILDGDRAAEMAEQADFYPELSYAKRYKTMKCVNRSDLDGKECFVVELVTHDDRKQTEYFDVETHLLSASTILTESQFGEMTVTSRIREYTQVEEIKVPTTIEVDTQGMVRTMKFDLVEINKVDPAAFDLPDEIVAIMPEGDDDSGEAEEDEDGDGG